jgi:hypothetical protein
MGPRSQPEEVNGVITGYRLYYMHNNFTDVVTIHSSAPQMQHTLSSLSKLGFYLRTAPSLGNGRHRRFGLYFEVFCC